MNALIELIMNSERSLPNHPKLRALRDSIVRGFVVRLS
jgi:hypothetical protein